MRPGELARIRCVSGNPAGTFAMVDPKGDMDECAYVEPERVVIVVGSHVSVELGGTRGFNVPSLVDGRVLWIAEERMEPLPP